MRYPSSIILVFLLLLLGCKDPLVVKFEHKAKGANPRELIGDFHLQAQEDSTIHESLISFTYLGKRQYLVTDMLHDTLYMGEIVRKKQDYFFNIPDKEEGYWNIRSFRIVGDSVYNFWRSLIWNDEKQLVEGKYFKKYRTVEEDGTETWYINNSRKETYAAFSDINQRAEGIFFKKVELGSEETMEPFPFGETSDDELFTVEAYPNPVADIVTIEIPRPGPATAQLFTLEGQLVGETTLAMPSVDWSLAEIPTGTYILRVSGGEDTWQESLKLIKQ